MGLTIETEKRGGSTVAKVVSRTIEADNVMEFRNGMEPLVTTPQNLVLDLSAVEFMDSSALGALLSCLRKISSSGGTLRLAALAPPVKMLFSVVKMDRAFSIFETVDDAAG